MSKINSVKFTKASNPKKKYTATFFDKDNKKIKTTHFGFRSKTDKKNDFTLHGDEARKQSYLARHEPREDWTSPTTAGALSRWILWHKKSLNTSMADYGKRFKIKVINNT
jgi:hypothetical protein